MAIGLGTILSGSSALLGLLGGSKKYGSAGDMKSGREGLGALSGVRDQYGNLASQGMNDYGADNADYRSALDNEEQYLATDPYTSSRDAADLAQGTQGATSAYQKDNSDLTASLASRGITDGSILGGGLAYNANQKAGTFAGAENQLAYNKINSRNPNNIALLNLTSGAANQDYGRATGALGAEGGLDQNLASSYLGLGQNEQDMEQHGQQQDAQAIGSAATMAGQAYGFGAGGPAGAAAGGAAAGSLMPLLVRKPSLLPVPPSSFGEYGGQRGGTSFSNYRPTY